MDSSTKVDFPVNQSSADSPYSSKTDPGDSGWYIALSRAWGQALDSQADKVVSLSSGLATANPSIGDVMRVSAEAQMFSVLSSSASNVNSSIGKALETLGRKQ